MPSVWLSVIPVVLTGGGACAGSGRLRGQIAEIHSAAMDLPSGPLLAGFEVIFAEIDCSAMDLPWPFLLAGYHANQACYGG